MRALRAGAGERRRLGRAGWSVANAGTSKQQRGTSKKGDVMYVVIKRASADVYQAEMGAAWTVEFEKARHLSGGDALSIEASLKQDEHGNQAWVHKDAELGMSERILALHVLAPELNQSELAEELGCNRSTVSRAIKNAHTQAAGIQ